MSRSFHELVLTTEAPLTQTKGDALKRLQAIRERFLREYVIRVGEFVVEPLLVETYYHNPPLFSDGNVHGSDKQKNRFGKLYFHETGRGGVDICLSCGDYYFSLLIKNSLVTEGDRALGFQRQTELYDLLKGFRDMDAVVLEKRENANDAIVFHTVRKGLVKDNAVKSDRLASVTGFERKDPNGKRYRFDLEKGYTKEYLVVEYLKAHPGEFSEATFKNAFLDYVPKTIRETPGLLK